ncbi:MAG TPA: hypothetical protein VGG39_19280 [Polyangiaceae bacterium]
MLALLLGVSLVVGVLRGGSHYFYCPFMDVVVTEHCCTGARARDRATTVEAPDCCEARTIGVLPSAGSLPPGPGIAAASCVAVLPTVQGVAAVATRIPVRFTVSSTGPPPSTGAQRVARLMVFLI